MAVKAGEPRATGGSGQVPFRLGRWIVFGVVVVVTASVLAVITLGVVQGLQLPFTDWWTELAVVLAALVVVVFLVTIGLVVAAQSKIPTPFGAFFVPESGVTVHLIQRSGDSFERLDHSVEKAKTWTVDSAGNLTVWSPDAAEATYPAGSWEGIERDGD